MQAVIFNDDTIAAFAFDERHDIGFSKVTIKDD